MDIRIVLVAAVAALAVPLPSALAAGGAPDERPPLLVIDHLGKYGGPVLYVDHDGKVWRETNLKVNLQREAVLEGGTLRPADDNDVLP